MQYNYDVIVIGAGNGGLSAAATTARGGKKTLVLERHNLPGGSATSFVRGRFEFESALHELCDLGTPERPGTVRKLFEQYDAKMKWHLEHNLFHLIVPGKTDIVLPSGIEPFCKKMEELVPGCEASVRELIRLGALAGEAQNYAMSPKSNKLVLMTKYADFLRLASLTTREGFEAKGVFIANCLNVIIPEASPKGTCTLFFTTFGDSKEWGSLAPRDYYKKKEQRMNDWVDYYEKTTGITIRPYIEEITFASPATFCRYLNTPNGTPYGYQVYKWDNIINRLNNLDKEQMFKGLRLTGAACENIDGYNLCYLNGNIQGKKTLKDAEEDK